MIRRTFLGGGEDEAGRQAYRCWKTSSVLLRRLSFSSQLPLPLSLFSTETVSPTPLPFTPAPANNQLKGHKAPTTPTAFSPLPCLCVSQNYPKTAVSRRTGFRGDSEEKKSPTFFQNLQLWESVQSRGGGGSLWSNNGGRKQSLNESGCTGPKVQAPNNKWLRLMKAISNFMTEKQTRVKPSEAEERARHASSAGLRH